VLIDEVLNLVVPLVEGELVLLDKGVVGDVDFLSELGENGGSDVF